MTSQTAPEHITLRTASGDADFWLVRQSIHTERSYAGWVVRFVHFHNMQSSEDLLLPEPKIEAFLTYLPVEQNVAPATQNQAINALGFLYKRVLGRMALS